MIKKYFVTFIQELALSQLLDLGVTNNFVCVE